MFGAARRLVHIGRQNTGGLDAGLLEELYAARGA